jgi:hypothetical protein
MLVVMGVVGVMAVVVAVVMVRTTWLHGRGSTTRVGVSSEGSTLKR